MRTLFSLATALFITAGPLLAPAQGADRDVALAVVEQAVKAHGGAEAMARALQMTRGGSGVLAGVGAGTPFTDELVLSLPDRFRLTLDVGQTGQARSRIILVVGKEKGWQRTGGMTLDLGADRLEELRGDAYLLWLTTLTPLLKDESLTLVPQQETKVDGQPAAVIKVSRKGQPDVRLYFDKTSSLLIRTERKAREGGAEFSQEYTFSEHKEFDGLKLPTHIIESRSGRKFTELTGLKYKLLSTPDEAAFGKP